MKTHVGEKMVQVMLKVEQEGERLNKVLNEIENKLVHITNKPTRYFQMIRDLRTKSCLTTLILKNNQESGNCYKCHK